MKGSEMKREMLVPGNVEVDYLTVLYNWKDNATEEYTHWLKASGHDEKVITAYEEGFKSGWLKAIQTLNLHGATKIKEIEV